MPIDIQDTQLTTLDGYLANTEAVPVTADPTIAQSVVQKLTAANAAQKLTTATADLHRCLSQLAIGTKPEQLTVSPETDALIGFAGALQSKLIAAQTIHASDTEAIKEAALAWVKQILHVISAIGLQYASDPSQIGRVSSFVDRYNKRAATHAYLQILTNLLLSYQIARTGEEEKEQPTVWSPLATVRGQSATEIMRIIIRATATDQQLEADLDSLLFNLAKAVHLEWSPPQVQPVWRQSAVLYEWVNAQTTRDRVGAQFAPYLAKLLSGSAEAYDPEFHAAFNAMLQAVQLYYQSLPATAAVQSEANTPAPAPAVTPPASTSAPQQIPVSTPATVQSTPIITPTTTESVPVPGATVDLRTAQPTPPTPPSQPAPTASQTTDQPPADQPRIKPLNLP